MRKLRFQRKKRLAAFWIPYWIITNTSRDDFLNIVKQSAVHKKTHYGITNITYPHLNIADYGTRIKNGKTIEIDISDDIKSFFVIRRLGVFGYCDATEEIFIHPGMPSSWVIDTKPGGKTASYPFIYEA